MIVVRITGGLGNQMFQYAAGRALAERHGVPLRLDLDEYGRATVHEGYVLDRAFGVRARAMGPLGRALVAAWRLQPGRPRWVVRLDPRVPGAASNELLERAPAACYLNGYWQDERCFAPIAASVRRELTVADTALADLGPLATRVQDEASVAVHVRRGDYLGIGLGHFVQLGPDHYAEAARLVAALPTGCRLVLVGDPDQLPSVGPGDVLRDLLRSQRVPVAVLGEVHRQAAGSRIVALAGAVLSGEVGALAGVEADFAIDPHTKHCLIGGLDDIALTLVHEADITAYEATRDAFRPKVPTA